MDAATIEARINRGVEWALTHWILLASGWAALVVAGAVVTPLLAANGYDDAAWVMYKLYRVLCPQRPSHSWFIQGHKMGFEQRDTAMFLAGALAGPLYIVARRFGFRGLPGKLVLLLQIPILVDVFSQVFGLRDSDAFWRTLTGFISVWAVAGWLYPILDTDFRAARDQLRATRLRPAAAPPPQPSPALPDASTSD
jgi:uncharacterized membrane protein